MDQTTSTTPIALEPKRSCLEKGLWALLNGTGLLLVACVLPMIYFNETSLIEVARGLKEARKDVTSVAPNVIDPKNEGKLVHVAGMLEVTAPLSDPMFSVTLPALKLSRELEMFQWVETTQVEERYEGGTKHNYTRYFYNKNWANRLIDASKFNTPQDHDNPKAMPGQDERKWTRTAQDAKLGVFQIRPEQLEKVVGDNLLYQQDANPPQNVAAPVFTERGLTGQLMGGGEPGWMYFGKDRANPVLGDVRVRYRFVPPKEVTIVAAQAGQKLEPFPEKSGTKVDVVRNGIETAGQALDEETLVNHLGTWFLRFVLWFALAGALAMSVTAWRRLPGLRIAAGAPWWGFGPLGAAGLCFVIVAVPWMLARPLTGLGLFVLGAVLLSSLHRIGARRRASAFR